MIEESRKGKDVVSQLAAARTLTKRSGDIYGSGTARLGT